MRYTIVTLLLAAAAAGATPASAQIVVADTGDQKLTVAGYVQPQYTRIDREDAASRDTTLFRRMVLTLQATANQEWLGAFQFDLAPAAVGDHVVVKDAYVQYWGGASAA